jgi:hypothetical protein
VVLLRSSLSTSMSESTGIGMGDEGREGEWSSAVAFHEDDLTLFSGVLFVPVYGR